MNLQGYVTVSNPFCHLMLLRLQKAWPWDRLLFPPKAQHSFCATIFRRTLCLKKLGRVKLADWNTALMCCDRHVICHLTTGSHISVNVNVTPLSILLIMHYSSVWNVEMWSRLLFFLEDYTKKSSEMKIYSHKGKLIDSCKS